MQQQLLVNDNVFVKDEDHVWLPAKVTEIETDRILVEIDLPSDWTNTTTVTRSTDEKSQQHQHQQLGLEQQEEKQQQPKLEEHTSPQQCERRWVHLDEYKDRQLPLQNTSTSSSSTRDIAELPHLHEAAVLYQIKSRHVAKKPYTRVGDIVIAVNPCQWIDKLYTAEQRHLYAKSLVWQVPDAVSEEKKQEDGLSTTTSPSSTCFNSTYDKLGFEPHVYEVSALAYRGLFLDGKNQTILVSGESGAGKTETVKIVLKHLAGLETAALMPPDDDDNIDNGTLMAGGGAELVRLVVSSSSIFEAFGNAMTLRNDNSSRFGRMTQLYFTTRDDNGMCGLRGSTSSTYLFEAIRVVQQSPGERNFHIFYQLLAAPSQTKRQLLGEMWEHAQPRDFKLLNEPKIQARLGRAADEEQWLETFRALDFFQFKGTKLEALVQALGIILLLGNIVFAETPDGSCGVSSLDDVADALGIPVDSVERALTQHIVQTSHDRIEVPMRPEVAKDCLDALVKKMYACIFESVVDTINEKTHDSNEVSKTTGIIRLLDIYGFECFQVNRFEQFCINFANEKLHKMYTNDNFCRFEVEYEEQGIQAFDFELIDNSAILDIFEGRSGLISGITEECVRRDGSSLNFVRKAKKQHRSSERFFSDHLHFHDAEFGVTHFAGPVIYDASEFVERNTDKLPFSLLSMAVNTTNPLIRESFKKLLKDEQALLASDFRKKRTVLERFQTELKDLMSRVAETQTRYIRCIKPNESLLARSFDHACVLRQLRCAGIVAAIDLTRQSFPSKLSFQTAEERFVMLLKETQVQDMLDMDAQDRAQFMLSILFAPLLEVYRNCEFTLPYTIGTSKIYFRAGALELLEGLRQDYFSCRAAKIQRTWRRTANGSRVFGRFKRSIILLQSNTRTRFAHCSFHRVKRSTKVIQFWHRSHILKTQYDRMKRGFTALQQRYRLVSERNYRYTRAVSAIKIQSTSRCWISGSRYRRMKRGFVRLQGQHRANLESRSYAYVLKSRFHRTRNGFVLFQAQYRGISGRRRQAQSRADLSKEIQREHSCDDGGDGGGLEATSLKNTVSRYAATKEDVEEATTINDNIPNEKDCTDHDKGKIDSLRAQIKRLQDELECRNKEVAELHQTVANVTEEAEIHTQEIEGEYEDRLAAYEEEVVQLKQELEENRASHEKTIEQLMHDSHQQGVEYKKHLESVSLQIEMAKEMCKVEAEKVMEEIQAVKSEKNETILHLEAQLARARSTMMMTPPALTVASPCTDESDWSSSTVERDHPSYLGRDVHEQGGGEGCNSYLDEVEKLRRDLLTITATHNLAELVQKASMRPWQKDVHIERLYKSVESRVNRLGDLAVQRYMWCEEPTVKHMHIDNTANRSPMHVDVVSRTAPSPTSSLDDSSQETKP